MSKSLLSLFVAVLFVLGFTSGIAYAGGNQGGGPAQFESSLIDITSQFRIGQCRVHRNNNTMSANIEVAEPNNVTLKLCFQNDDGQGHCCSDAINDANREFKCQCDITGRTPPDNNIMEGFICNIYSGGTASTCDGTLEYTSGVDVDD